MRQRSVPLGKRLGIVRFYPERLIRLGVHCRNGLMVDVRGEGDRRVLFGVSGVFWCLHASGDVRFEL
jgi:hypothetical protein